MVLRYRLCQVHRSTHPRLWLGDGRSGCGRLGQWPNGICDHHREMNRRLGLEGALSLVPLEAPEGAMSLAPAGRLSLSAGGEHG